MFLTLHEDLQKICSRFSDIASFKINFTAFGLQREHPLARELINGYSRIVELIHFWLFDQFIRIYGYFRCVALELDEPLAFENSFFGGVGAVICAI